MLSKVVDWLLRCKGNDIEGERHGASWSSWRNGYDSIFLFGTLHSDGHAFLLFETYMKTPFPSDYFAV